MVREDIYGCSMENRMRIGVEILTGTKALALNNVGLEIQKNTGTENLPADSVVIATGAESENQLLGYIEELVP